MRSYLCWLLLLLATSAFAQIRDEKPLSFKQCVDLVTKARAQQNRDRGAFGLVKLAKKHAQQDPVLSEDEYRELLTLTDTLLDASGSDSCRAALSIVTTLKLASAEAKCIGLLRGRNSVTQAAQALAAIKSPTALAALRDRFPVAADELEENRFGQQDDSLIFYVAAFDRDDAKPALEAMRKKTESRRYREKIDLALDRLDGIGE